MKFTCDSCGAQYMIGDEKLGKRGVKVRCKKCSYVIILRPTGYQPSDKKSGQHDEPPTGDMTPSAEARITLPPEALGPTAPSARPPFDDPLSDQDSLASSELGLSKEFAAMGFDEEVPPSKPIKSKALNVNLEVAKIEPVFPDQSSPFQIGATGGSALDLGLAASLPRLQRDDDSSDELTSVDQTPFAGAPPPPFEDDELDATNPGHDQPPRASLGAGDPPSSAFNDDESDDLQTRRVSYDSSKKEQKPVSMSFDDDNLSDKLKALEKNELQDMHASLDQSLANVDSNWGNKRREPPPAPPRGKSSSAHPPKATKPNLASLNALAAAAEESGGGASLPSFVSPSIAAAAPVAPTVVGPVHATSAHSNGDGVMHEGPMLDNELKSAFDAMFSPAAAATPAFQEGNLAANTVQESAPAELFRSAYQSEADRRPTRVFDVEAMQQVQAEQDRAQRPVSVVNGKKKTDDGEWYVAVNDEQVGPLTFADVKAKWEANEIAPSSLCWKQGMPDWTAVKNVKEMEALGDMDDRVRTVVQHVESNEEAEEHADEPPTIAHPEDNPKKSEPRAAAGKEDSDDSEPSWRPSAASALASLAAAELEPLGAKDSSFTDRGDRADRGDRGDRGDRADVAVGRALPATSDALEKLLLGDPKTSKSSPFGAAEMSSSNIRPLPKRSDHTSSVSLRDPIVATRERQKTMMIPLAIVGGFVFIGVVLFAVLRGPSQPAPSQAQIAAVLPQMQTQQPGQPQQVAQPQTTQAVATTDVRQAAEVVQNPGTQNPQNPVTQPVSAQTQLKTEVKSEQPKGEVKSEQPSTEVKSEQPKSGDRGTKKSPREKEQRETKEERPKKEEKHEKEELADIETPRNEEDDLLGGHAKQQKRLPKEEPSSDLPAQLEDSDILGELRKHKAAIQACRQKQSSASSSVEGTLTITFVIEGNGKTKRWEAKPDNLKSSVGAKCVIDSVKTWSFPKFSGRPMPVDFPVRLGGK